MLMVMLMEPAVNALANDKAARGINSPVRRLVLVMHVILTFCRYVYCTYLPKVGVKHLRVYLQL